VQSERFEAVGMCGVLRSLRRGSIVFLFFMAVLAFTTSAAAAPAPLLPGQCSEVLSAAEREVLRGLRVQSEPLYLIVLLDESASMDTHGANGSSLGRAAVVDLLNRALRPEDFVSVLTFNADSHERVDWGHPKDVVAALNAPRSGDDETTDIGQAVEWSIDRLEHMDRWSLAAILLVSDGEISKASSPYRTLGDTGWPKLKKRVNDLTSGGRQISSFALQLGGGSKSLEAMKAVLPRSVSLDADANPRVCRVASEINVERRARAKALLSESQSTKMVVTWPRNRKDLQFENRTATLTLKVSAPGAKVPLRLHDFMVVTRHGLLHVEVPQDSFIIKEGETVAIPVNIRRRSSNLLSHGVCDEVEITARVDTPWGAGLQELGIVEAQVTTDWVPAAGGVCGESRWHFPWGLVGAIVGVVLFFFLVLCLWRFTALMGGTLDFRFEQSSLQPENLDGKRSEKINLGQRLGPSHQVKVRGVRNLRGGFGGILISVKDKASRGKVWLPRLVSYKICKSGGKVEILDVTYSLSSKKADKGAKEDRLVST
jgi:hypothetical protein